VTPEHIFQLTRRFIDVESITGNEAAMGELLLATLCAQGWHAEKMPVEGERFNVYATNNNVAPVMVFSTHFDTVPPFIPSREDDDNIYGRGACDTKGIIAAMLAATERLRGEDKNVPIALLFVVGEERDSQGAKVANLHAPDPRPRFLINGEPTENKVATASKGTLRVELTARGKMAHSAYPHLGESATEKLLDALERIRKVKLPVNADPAVGAATMNIGILEGGRAPNVIPDFARAHLLYRMVGPVDGLVTDLKAAVGNLAEVNAVLDIPFVKLRSFGGLPTFVAAYTTDIPALSEWGEPILFGPGSIHVAHTDNEYIGKKQQLEAVDIYVRMAKELLRDARA